MRLKMSSVCLSALIIIGSISAAFAEPLKGSVDNQVGITAGGSLGTPEPPICNTASQMLHWNGSSWQCIANPGISSYGKGSIVGFTTHNCPGGSTRYYMSSSKSKCPGATTAICSYPKYMCVKN